MDEDAAQSRCGARRTPRSCAPPSSSATARRARPCRPATPARPWPRRCCGSGGIKGVVAAVHRDARPAAGLDARASCATPAPTPSARAEMLVQFAQMGERVRDGRYGVARPAVGLLSIGEEPTKGTPLVKETHERLADPAERRARSSATSRAATCIGVARRRRRHRRVHRQRGAEDPRGRAPVHVLDDRRGDRDRRGDQGGRRRAAWPTCCPSPRTSTRTPTAGPCCSASTGSA